MAKVFLDANDKVALSYGTFDVFGTSGRETVIAAGTASIVADANVEQIDLSGDSSDYTFVANGISISAINSDGDTVAVMNGTSSATVRFADGSADLAIDTGLGAITLGGAPIQTVASSISPSLNTDNVSDADVINSGLIPEDDTIITESVGALSAVNNGSGTNMVLDFFADESLVGSTITSFDAVVEFNTSDASYQSAEVDPGYLGVVNGSDGAVSLGGISLSGVSSSDPLFTVTLTDQDLSEDLAISVSSVFVNGDALDGSTLLIS